MKKLLLISALLFSFNASAKELIHPLDFKGTEQEKEAVISFIKADVYKTYCEDDLFGVCTEAMVRQQEELFLEGFKKLTKAQDRAVLDKVMKMYCDNDHEIFYQTMVLFCNYALLSEVYEQELNATNSELTW